MPLNRIISQRNRGENTSKRLLLSLARHARIGKLRELDFEDIGILYHYTPNPDQLKKHGFKNYTPQEVEELGLITAFGAGVYLTSRDIEGSRVQVKVRVKKVFFLDYNSLESRQSLMELLNESSENIDDWYASKIGARLQGLGYEAINIKVDFSKLTKEDHEANLESLFGAEHQVLVFDANNTEVIG